VRDSPPEGRDDLRLVEAAVAGDHLALEDLLRRHHDRLYGLCRRMAGNDADGQDACQEALIAVVRGLSRFDGRSSFSTWTYRVATNACLDELRRRSRRPEPGLPPQELHSGTGPGRPVGSGYSVAGDHAEAVVVTLEVDAALARLPADFRAAVVLRDLCDLPYDEIGEVLGIPLGTVRSRIARGRAALVPLLSGTGTGGGGDGGGSTGTGNRKTGNRGAGGERPTGRP